MLSYLQHHLENFLETTIADVYWKDRNGKYLGVNSVFLKVSGMRSEHDVIGSTDMDQIWNEQAPLMMKNDRFIISNECIRTCIEPAKNPNGNIVQYLSHKSPLRDRYGKVIGSFGLSYGIESQDWNDDRLNEVNMIVGTAGVEYIKRLLLSLQRKKHHLSKRQVDCLYYLVKGMTIKQISKLLSLSNRTVEHYLETVKIKLKCHSKAELIARAYEIGF